MAKADVRVWLSAEGLPEVQAALRQVDMQLGSPEVRALVHADPAWNMVQLDGLAARCLSMPLFEQGDLAFLRTKIKGAIGRWLVAFLIRVATFTRRDKRPSVVNHVAIIVGPVIDAIGRIVDYVIAEALGKGGFQYRRLLESYGDQALYDFAIARRRNLTEDQRAEIFETCENLIGRRYGFGKIIAHLIDYGLTKLIDLAGARGDVYLARRLCKQERYPMCSWSVLYAYDRAGVPFDMPVAKGSPDDLWDECRERKGPAPHLFLWSWMYATSKLRSCLIDRGGRGDG